MCDLGLDFDIRLNRIDKFKSDYPNLMKSKNSFVALRFGESLNSDTRESFSKLTSHEQLSKIFCIESDGLENYVIDYSKLEIYDVDRFLLDHKYGHSLSLIKSDNFPYIWFLKLYAECIGDGGVIIHISVIGDKSDLITCLADGICNSKGTDIKLGDIRLMSDESEKIFPSGRFTKAAR